MIEPSLFEEVDPVDMHLQHWVTSTLCYKLVMQILRMAVLWSKECAAYIGSYRYYFPSPNRSLVWPITAQCMLGSIYFHLETKPLILHCKLIDNRKKTCCPWYRSGKERKCGWTCSFQVSEQMMRMDTLREFGYMIIEPSLSQCTGPDPNNRTVVIGSKPNYGTWSSSHYEYYNIDWAYFY